MPHNRIIIDAKLVSMAGNATSGDVIDLKTTFDACDDLIGNSDIETAGMLHDFCDKVSDFTVGDFSRYASGSGVQEDTVALHSEGQGLLNA